MENPVVDNALDFVVRAATDLWNDQISPNQQLKYSTIELYEGIELLLKARLMSEHWSLILSRTDDYKKDSFQEGDFVSVNYDTARDRLNKFCNVELDTRAHESFKGLKSLRNRYVHFSCNESRVAVLAVQLRAWHHVLKLLEDGFLSELTEDQENILGQAREKMMRSEEFLDARLEEIQPEIETAKANKLLIVNCPHCERPGLIVGDGDPRCLVCQYEDSAGNVANEYASENDISWRHPRHGVDDDVAWCPGCGEQAVVPAGTDLEGEARTKLAKIPREPGEDWEIWICFSCGEAALESWFDSCSYCGAKYVNSDHACPACTMGL